MTTYVIPNDVDLELMKVLVVRYLRRPDGIVYADGMFSPPTALEYDPDLTPGEEVTLNRIIVKSRASALFDAMPNWATWSGDEAEAYVHDSILLGQTQAQVDAWIDAQITDLTTANLAQINARMAAIRIALKTIAAGLITTRTVLSGLARAIMYLRDVMTGRA